MTFSFVCCPKCREQFQLERAGPVGERGVKDSREIHCLECGTVFRTKGETWREAHGEHP